MNKRTNKKTEASASHGKGTAEGLQLDKKTVIGITVLLVSIMIFAGVLTRVVPRGQYMTHKVTDSEGAVNDAIINGGYVLTGENVSAQQSGALLGKIANPAEPGFIGEAQDGMFWTASAAEDGSGGVYLVNEESGKYLSFTEKDLSAQKDVWIYDGGTRAVKDVSGKYLSLTQNENGDTASFSLSDAEKTFTLYEKSVEGVLSVSETLQAGKTYVLLLDSYQRVNNFTMPVYKVLLAPILVFTSSTAFTGVVIILMIVLLGGTFLILDKCGVLKYIMAVIIKKFSSKRYLLLAVMVLALMTLSSVAGVLEESVTLVPLAVAISLALGWDSIVGVCISFVSVAFGFTAATFNPFNVVTTQGLLSSYGSTQVKTFSGLWLRLIVFVCVYFLLVGFLILYCKRIEKHPEKSPVYESDKKLREKYIVSDLDAVTQDRNLFRATRAFLIFIGLAFVCIMLDFIFDFGSYLSLGGLAVCFTVGGFIAGHITGLRGKKLFAGFFQGVKTIAPAMPLVIIVIAIAYILNEGMIIHTILHALYNAISGMTSYGAILLLFVFVAVLEFFIGSGTAKAFLIMPLVAPLSEMIGITGNTVVLSFCLADGFTNLLYPTSGIMIIAIGLIGLSYRKWLRFSWPLFVSEFTFSVIAMLFAVWVGYH